VSNFLKRTITGVLFLVIVAGSIYLDPYISGSLFGLIAILTYIELTSLFGREKGGPDTIRGIILGSLVYVLVFLISREIIPTSRLLLIIPIILLVVLSWLFSDRFLLLKRITHTLAGTAYVFIPFSLTNVLLNPGLDSGAYHPEILMGVLIVIWTNDVFAYLGGKFYGRHKFFKKVSPHKTWEGTVTGIAFSLISGYVVSFILWEFNTVQSLVLSFFIAILGIFGDLLESTIKRSLNIKDSGKFLPGHGGLLDRFDAFLFSIPGAVVTIYLFLAI